VSAIPQERTVDALASVWTSLRELLLTLTPEQWHAPTALPGWDVQANVAHIIGTEASLLGQDASPVTNPPPEVDTEPPAHVRNEIGEFNELSVQAMATATPEEMVERFDEVTARRLTELREMPQGEWDAETMTPAGRNTYGRFMQIRVFDCWFHEQDIRDAVGRPGHGAGQAVVVTLDEITSALGFVVGKRAMVPEGCSVTFELTGSSGRLIHVEVTDRARVVDQLDGPASVTLSMGVVLFTRLCGGRATADQVGDQVTVTGDEAMGQRVLEHLAYTI
jgi:uncharacterized protein (TIGR03083 family)